MVMRIVINDREVTNPLAKFFIVFSAMVMAGLITAAVAFVVLPLVGITVAVSFAFVLAIVAASVVGAFILIIIGIIYSIIRGSLHVDIDKRRY